MPDYDSTRFAPPAPVAPVTLRNPDSGVTKEGVALLLDTGADVTLLPQHIVGELGLNYLPGVYELAGFGGDSGTAHAVRAELVFRGLTFRGQFLLVEQDWGIIGRNILKSMVLVCDGPN